jgi:hypothetical protein
MAKQRTSVQKRRKEASRMEKRMQKQLRKSERKDVELDPNLEATHEDPDLIGITPGPQQIPDYSY